MRLDFPKGVSQAGDPNQAHSFYRTWLLLSVHEQSEFNSQNASGTSWSVFVADEKHLATDVTWGHKDKERVKFFFLFFMVLDTYDFFKDATKLAHPPTPTARQNISLTVRPPPPPPTPPPHTHILTPSVPSILHKIKLLLVFHNCWIRYVPEANPMRIPPSEFSSVHLKMVSMHLEKPTCTPPRLPEMSPLLPLEHLQKPKAGENNTNGKTQTLTDDAGFRLHHNFNLLMSSLRKSVLKSKQSNSLNNCLQFRQNGFTKSNQHHTK